MKARLHVALLVAALGLAACSTTFDGIEDTPEARGKRALLNGNLGLAITHYQTALERAPASIEALNGLAASYDRLGRFDVAQRYYDRALMLDRHAAQTLNNIGYSYLLQGKHEVAAAYFKQALNGDRNDRIVQANLQLAESAAAAGKERVAAASTKAPDKSIASDRAAGTPSADARPMRIERVNATTQMLVVREQYRQTAHRQKELADTADTFSSANTAPFMQASLVMSSPSLPLTTGSVADRALSSPRAASGAQRQPRMIVEVSNGTGRTKMAARMRGYLKDNGMTVTRLTNADSFAYRATTIAYKPGSKATAEVLAGMLPIECRITPDEQAFSDIKMTLGADLRDFDIALLLANRERHVRFAAR